MATTTNYSWSTPDDTALVKDGAAAIRSLGTAIDTTTKNLNPSTTLGDIEYRSSTANTNTRLGIGTTGQVLTVSGGVPSWATPAGSSFNVERNFVSTSQTTNSTSYTDLATTQSITLTTGTKVLVMLSCGLDGDTTDQSEFASIAVSGATTIAASDERAIQLENTPGAYLQARMGITTLITCTAGSNTFTAKFRASSAFLNARFYNRELIVIDLGS